MRIKDELYRIAATVPEIAESFYGADFEANIKDDSLFPFLHIQAIETGAIQRNPGNGLYRDSWNVFLFLCTKSELDNSMEENQEIIETEVLPVLRKLLHAINSDGAFSTPDRFELKIHHFRFTFLCSGIMAYMVLTEAKGSPMC